VTAAETSRRPGEFLYWEHAGKPWARAFRAGCKAALGFDPAPPDDVVETIASLYYDADPLAEAFVEEVYLGSGLGSGPGSGPGRGPAAGRAMLDQAIAGGVASVPDAPASLKALFADIEVAPAWVDRALVDRGARVFRRYGSAMFRFAGAVTLEAYSESSVAKPLILTGAYAGGGTRHRFLETVAFWIAVSEPGGLEPGAPGLASALRVRIMHVFVRKRLLSHPEWNLAAWGVPISQGDALLTLMGGSFAPGVAMQAMGYRPSVADIEAMMHFWRYVGHLMGVRPRWYPASMKEAFQLAYVTIVKGAHRAGEDGVHLCQSYAEAFTPETPADATLGRRLSDAWHDGIHRGYTRFFLPPWTYRKNRLPPAGLWALHPLLQFPFIFAAETLRRAFPRLDGVADRVARRSRQRWFARHMGDRGAEYNPATSFTR
jgi:hypothetical protein